MIDLGTLGGSNSHAYAINDAGYVAGSSTLAHPNPQQEGTTHAFRYRDGVMIDLGTLGGNSSIGYAITGDDRVAGVSTLPDGTEHAFLWDNGVMQDLGSLGGPTANSAVYGGGSAGVLTGYTCIAPHNAEKHAFIYYRAEMLDLGLLHGQFQTEGYGANDYGNAVGTAWLPGDEQTAFFYSKDKNQMFELKDLVVDGEGWTLKAAVDISLYGHIAGWGISPSGERRAFLLNPVNRWTFNWPETASTWERFENTLDRSDDTYINFDAGLTWSVERWTWYLGIFEWGDIRDSEQKVAWAITRGSSYSANGLLLQSRFPFIVSFRGISQSTERNLNREGYRSSAMRWTDRSKN